jgi:hypothetical protein
MRSDVEVREDLTLSTFGYNLSEQNISRKKIVVVCKNCNKIIHREFRNRYNKHQCPSIDGNKKKCYKCNCWKDFSLFNKSPKLSGGVSKLCRNCYNNHEAVKKSEIRRKKRLKESFKENFDLYIQTRINNIRSRCKSKNIEFDLTKEFLIELWESQNGACYYTNLPMKNSMKTNGFQSWDSPSLDRIDPNFGYIKGNIVWCLFSINSFKQSLTIEEFEKQIRSINWWFTQ